MSGANEADPGSGKTGLDPGSSLTATGETRKAPTSAYRFLLVVIASILGCEILVMFFISVLPPLPVNFVAFLDALLLGIVTFPVLYFFLFRPLVRHITERQKIEEQLRKANELNETLIKTIPLGIDILDEDGRIIYLNETLQSMVGREAIGGMCWVVYLNRAEKCDGCPLAEGVEIGKTRSNVVEGMLGDRTVLVSYTGMMYQNRKAILRVLEDITDNRRLEEELRQAQKMEAVGRLAGGVAHDFNNLLTAITGYSELLLSRLNAGDPLRRDAEKIHEAGERAASLTRQLLAFSRKQMLQPKVLDLNALVSDMERLLRRLIGEDIALVTVLEPSLERVRADAGQIGQVVMNLVLNARDAMAEGGRLSIRTENVEFDASEAKNIHDAHSGRFVSLVVEDTGVGIPKEIVDRIFEPFFSTKGQGKGTGLGLSVVYGIMRQHEGWVNVESEPQRGSTFRIFLPAIPAQPEENRPKEAVPIEQLQGRGERILVVEDETEVRAFGARILREHGYTVFEAESTQEALDVFRREGSDVALIFSDVVLPDKTGVQLVEQILSVKPEVNVLFTSGYADSKSQWPAIQKRGFPFLPKPYAVGDLLAAVRDALQGRRGGPPKG